MGRYILTVLACLVVTLSIGQIGQTNQINTLADSIDAYKPIAKTSIQFRLLPIVNKLQYVGDHPYDWNDGVMIAARGWQQYTNAGVNLTWKQFELQIAPEFVAAQNLNFEGFGADMDEIQWRDYYRFQNFIEQPAQFGKGQYTRLFFGQSFLKYNFKNTIISVSTANQWWGPTKRNALILSNNA
ncbi:MAG: hypothetical protein HQ449_05620, partial [Chitinophagaceae bacterium]|nr:hypothetical protein [Chitinophagaceae bacterium]